MDKDADKATSPTLLPPSGRLMPVSDSGKLLDIDSRGSEKLAHDLAQTGDKAKEFAERAAAFTSAKVPEIKKKAQEARVVVSDLSRRTWQEGTKSAAAARDALADPENRRAMIAANRQKLIIGVITVVAVIGGGWLYAKHRATSMVTERIEAYLDRNNLRDTVSYGGISASPFGSATISDVRVRTSPTITIKFGAITVSDVKAEGDILTGISLSAKSMEVPILQIAQENLSSHDLDEAIGLGYTTLVCDVGVSALFDEHRGVLSFDTFGDIHDLAGWKLTLKFGDIDVNSARILDKTFQTAREAESNSDMRIAMGSALRMIGQMTLVQADLSLDNAGWLKRSKEIPDTGMPMAAGTEVIRDTLINEKVLISGGMSPAEARDIKKALEASFYQGSPLHIKSHMARPEPLFKHGYGLEPRITSLEKYLLITKSTVSN